MRLVTACSFLEKASLGDMSATFAELPDFCSMTALIDTVPYSVSPLRITIGIAQLSELEYLPAYEHHRVPKCSLFLDLAHSQCNFSRLQMGDIDIDLPLEFCQLLGQHTRT